MIGAFKQLRLTSNLLSGSGSSLVYAGNTLVNQTQTGSLVGQNMTGVLVGVNQTGQFVGVSQTGQFVGVSQTGFIASQSYVQTVSGDINTRLNQTGQTLIGMMAGQVAGVSSINAVTGTLTLSGYGNITVSNVGTAFKISGDTGQFVGVSQTGQFVGVSQTGQFMWTGSQQSFAYTIPTGIDMSGVLFPQAFGAIPRVVQTSIEVTGDVMYYMAIRNRATTGYWAIFSDTITESGVVLHTLAIL